MNGANGGETEGLWGSTLGSLHSREGWKHQSEGLIASCGAAQEGLLMSTFPWLVEWMSINSHSLNPDKDILLGSEAHSAEPANNEPNVFSLAFFKF